MHLFYFSNPVGRVYYSLSIKTHRKTRVAKSLFQTFVFRGESDFLGAVEEKASDYISTSISNVTEA